MRSERQNNKGVKKEIRTQSVAGWLTGHQNDGLQGEEKRGFALKKAGVTLGRATVGEERVTEMKDFS